MVVKDKVCGRPRAVTSSPNVSCFCLELYSPLVAPRSRDLPQPPPPAQSLCHLSFLQVLSPQKPPNEVEKLTRLSQEGEETCRPYLASSAPGLMMLLSYRTGRQFGAQRSPARSDTSWGKGVPQSFTPSGSLFLVSGFPLNLL